MNLRWPKKLLFFTILFFMVVNTYGQTSFISDTINDYAKVTAVNTSCNSVTVTTTTGFNMGGKVLLIQMKGASVNGGNNNTFGSLAAGGIGNAGNYEFNEILDIQGFVVYLKFTILKTYNPVGLQLVTIPQYVDATITGTLTALPWNGNVGGVLVFEASGTVTFDANINVEGLGFRGGARSLASGFNDCAVGGATYYTAANTAGYGHKGESISEFITGREAAQANQANGGGGGHSNNSGGGGGSNYGVGGRGGRQAKGCGILSGPWGLGGIALATNYTTDNKIFAGGGGGGGHQNNYVAPGPPFLSGATAGNPGGGIVIIKANSITGNSHRILAGGFNGNSLIGKTLEGISPSGYKVAIGDSGGGGGGGGTVLLSTTAGYNGSPLNVDVRGGRGDSVFTEVNTNLGPGGGGGGGVLWVNSATIDPIITRDITGGTFGTSYHQSIPAVCQCANGAAVGNTGAVLNNLVIPQNPLVFNPPCTTVPVTLLTFSGKENNGKIHLTWATASEINNDHFVLEKSADGFHYDYLTTIKGNGNTGHTISYSYTDLSPFTGANYYRLKQYDFDNTEHTSGHALVVFSGAGAIIEKIYPNPFTNELIIQSLFALDKNQTDIKIFNLLGSELYSISPTYDGQNIILNTSFLAKGVYFLQLTTQGRNEIRKIIKE